MHGSNGRCRLRHLQAHTDQNDICVGNLRRVIGGQGGPNTDFPGGGFDAQTVRANCA